MSKKVLNEEDNVGRHYARRIYEHRADDEKWCKRDLAFHMQSSAESWPQELAKALTKTLDRKHDHGYQRPQPKGQNDGRNATRKAEKPAHAQSQLSIAKANPAAPRHLPEQIEWQEQERASGD